LGTGGARPEWEHLPLTLPLELARLALEDLPRLKRAVAANLRYVPLGGHMLRLLEEGVATLGPALSRSPAAVGPQLLAPSGPMPEHCPRGPGRPKED
jgi:hypothetical protein